MQYFRGTPEVLFAADGSKIAQVTQFHAALIPFCYQKGKYSTLSGINFGRGFAGRQGRPQ